MPSKRSKQQLQPLKMQWQPHAYQKKAVKFLLEHAAGALFLDPGLGKTSITLAALKVLQKRDMLEKTLIIAPLRVIYTVWPKEMEQWRDFNGFTYTILHGRNKEANLAEDVDFYLINPEGLEWLFDVTKTKDAKGKVIVHVNMRRVKKLGFKNLVVDELSKLKNTRSIRYKAMKQVLHLFGRRWGLTGSPAANGLMDLFGQCYILDQGRSLGRFITHYRNKYFDQGYDGFTYTLKEGADKEIYKRLKPLALRMSAEDHLDIPKLVENNIFVQLPDKVYETYLQLQDDLVAKVHNGMVTAKTAAVASMKCRQVASGGVYLDQEVSALIKLPSTKRETVHLHDAKTDALEELIDELQGTPLMVAYEFHHDLERLQKRFGKKVPVIGQGSKPAELQKVIRNWSDRAYPYIFVQPQSGALGIDGFQTAGNHICFYSMIWNYEYYDQLIRRLRRQGNKAKRVFLHHLIAEGTIDEIVLSVLKLKKRGQNDLFNALRSLKNRN